MGNNLTAVLMVFTLLSSSNNQVTIENDNYGTKSKLKIMLLRSIFECEGAKVGWLIVFLNNCNAIFKRPL